MVVDLPDTPEIMVLRYDDKPMEGLKDHLQEEHDPKKDQEVDEVVGEQQIDQEINEAVGAQ